MLTLIISFRLGREEKKMERRERGKGKEEKRGRIVAALVLAPC